MASKHQSAFETFALFYYLPKAIFIHKNYDNDPRFSGLKSIINGSNKISKNDNCNRGNLSKIREYFDSI